MTAQNCVRKIQNTPIHSTLRYAFRFGFLCKEEEYEDDSSNTANIFKRRDRFIKFINESSFLKSEGLKWM